MILTVALRARYDIWPTDYNLCIRLVNYINFYTIRWQDLGGSSILGVLTQRWCVGAFNYAMGNASSGWVGMQMSFETPNYLSLSLPKLPIENLRSLKLI